MLGGDGRKKNGGARAGAGRKAGLPNSSTLEFRNYVRQYTKEAVDMFVAAMRDEKMDMRFRLEAANWLVESVSRLWRLATTPTIKDGQDTRKQSGGNHGMTLARPMNKVEGIIPQRNLLVVDNHLDGTS